MAGPAVGTFAGGPAWGKASARRAMVSPHRLANVRYMAWSPAPGVFNMPRTIAPCRQRPGAHRGQQGLGLGSGQTLLRATGDAFQQQLMQLRDHPPVVLGQGSPRSTRSAATAAARR